ncbi:4F2 cell-surface antigen heavy chain [Gouania willdenowi]|uniref:4F2 cell-surface antigen heavy chain n=1 Tax=Gouania willdenowi TaxID=441366 RepID=UPI001055A86A|nr:4F2 cell-surface antigen heavy chain-like [Gouania willdenowi]XP_028320633.1 4F2 cell-surface antigen heavy chain-like [Gouania willdenowi]
MPLNAENTEYGSLPGAGLSGGPGDAEAAPLFAPEPVQKWRPMSQEELEAVAGGPGWRKARCYLVLLFWLSWLVILATAVAIIVLSPRPEAPELRWWQRTLFYQLRPQMFSPPGGSQGLSALSEQLPFFSSLGIGALILEGLFDKKPSPLNLHGINEDMTTIQHLLSKSNKANLKVVLDFCDLDLSGTQDDTGEERSNLSSSTQHAVRFWLEQGVAGFSICDSDEVYTEKTLLEWRTVFKEFGNQEEERIVLVKQTGDILLPQRTSSHSNITLINVIMRSILPQSHHLLTVQKVAEAIETHLQTQEEHIWLSWTIGGKVSRNLKRLLLVLTMTLPGSPVIQHGEVDQIQNVSLPVNGKSDEQSDASAGEETSTRSNLALFTSLSHSRAREEALLYGSFTFLPFNTSNMIPSNSTAPSPTNPPILAFLRSWGCVHFIILLNVGPVPHALDPAWAQSLPEAGVFVSSTGQDRLGSTSLYALKLQPYEAIVIKLFQGGSYS